MSSAPHLPLLIEPEQLQPYLADPAVLIVDLCDPTSYAPVTFPARSISITRIWSGPNRRRWACCRPKRN